MRVIHHFLFPCFSYPLFNMRKTREHTIQVRQMCVDLHKLRNGYKEIATLLQLPTSTVKEIIKNLKQLQQWQTSPDEDASLSCLYVSLA